MNGKFPKFGRIQALCLPEPVCCSLFLSHDILASGSDDRTIRIWNSRTSAQLQTLRGHTAYVRALLWHPELPYILFSGSWDSTIRTWDLTRGDCIYVASEHHADVYGLCCHPKRPFMLASTSRDTSLRFWAADSLAMQGLLPAILDPSRFEDIVATNDTIIKEATPFFFREKGVEVPNQTFDALRRRKHRLYGVGSRQLYQDLKALGDVKEDRNKVAAYRMIVSFFLFRRGIEA